MLIPNRIFILRVAASGRQNLPHSHSPARWHLGHNTHFLERLERLSSRHIDAAFMLYRDPVFVRKVLNSAKIPDNAERVALSLDDPVLGPFVVVARNGNFVTCLGVGMSTKQLPIVTRGQLDAVLAKLDRQRERMAVYQQQSQRFGSATKLWERVMRAGHRLSREEFVAAAALAPFLAEQLWPQVVEDYLALLETLDKVSKGARYKSLLKPGDNDKRMMLLIWNKIWMMGHVVAMLTQDGEAPEWVERFCRDEPVGANLVNFAVPFGMSGPLTRFSWVAGRLGKGLLKPSKLLYAGATHLHEHAAGLLALIAVGSRNPKLRGEVSKVIQRESPLSKRVKEMFAPEWYAAIRSLYGRLLTTTPGDAAFGLIWLKVMLHSRDTTLRRRYAEPTEIPDDIARATAANMHCSVLTKRGANLHYVAAAVSACAKEPVEMLYHEQEWLRQDPDPWTPQMMMTYLVEPFREFWVPHVPAKTANVIGRNDPCPCGSEKKYKKCCGTG